MIYLVQDCYKDKDGYHDILKIGYSGKSFGESRKSAYDTHNFGYTLISEREGSKELEGYLHRRLKDYRISLEWFKYDPEVIKIFNEVSEDDISRFTFQDELNEYIRNYVLSNLIPSVSKLSDSYLEDLLEELREESKKYPDLSYSEETLKKEILFVFRFVSSREKEYFQNLDFGDENIKNLLSECSLNLSRVPRRDLIYPFKNEITIFYKTQKNTISEEEFVSIQRKRKKATDVLLKDFQKLSKDGKNLYLNKLKDSIDLKKYSDDFVAISEKTNLPVYNYLIEIANERAWKVSQKDYQDNISVTRALEDAGFGIEKYMSEKDLILKDFLDNHFYATGIFREKMKLYCDFRDVYGNDQEIIGGLDFKISDPKYKMYYEYYGTSGCKSVSYLEADLYRGWKNITKEDKLREAIYREFKETGKYTLSYIKDFLASLYKSLGITKTPKTTDLGNYFTMTRTKITLPDKTVVHGFKLGSKLDI